MTKLMKQARQPITSYYQLGIAIVIVLTMVFAPQVTPNDWELNTQHLPDGINIYQNENFVYPPWSLPILWVHYLIQDFGTRLLAGAVVIWLAFQNAWSLIKFTSIILNPFFIFAMLFSNIDLIVITLPILIWGYALQSKRYKTPLQGISILLLLVKPQATFLILPLLIWQDRENLSDLVRVLGIIAVIIFIIGILGNPPLVLEWIDNITHPSAQNTQFWTDNNISLTSRSNVFVAILIVTATHGINYLLMRYAQKKWTKNHTYTVALISAMLISPYTSAQSVIASLAFVPSILASLVHYLLTFLSGQTDSFGTYAPFWILLFSISSLWLYKAHPSEEAT